MYVKGVKRFNAVYEVTGKADVDSSYRLAGQSFPEYVPVKELAVKEPKNGVAVSKIRQDLNAFKKLQDPRRWSSIVQMSAVQWDDDDGETILGSLRGNTR